MAAFVQRALTTMQKSVVRVVLTENKVARVVVGAVTVDVVHGRSLGNRLSQRTRNHEDVLGHVTTSFGIRVIWQQQLHIATPIHNATVLPTRMTRSAYRMPSAKTERFPPYPRLTGACLRSDARLLAAPAFTKHATPPPAAADKLESVRWVCRFFRTVRNRAPLPCSAGQSRLPMWRQSDPPGRGPP